jgi:hypothetical protein
VYPIGELAGPQGLAAPDQRTITGAVDNTKSPAISVSVRRLGQRVATYAAGMQIARASVMNSPLRSVAEIGCRKQVSRRTTYMSTMGPLPDSVRPSTRHEPDLAPSAAGAGHDS